MCIDMERPGGGGGSGKAAGEKGADGDWGNRGAGGGEEECGGVEREAEFYRGVWVRAEVGCYGVVEVGEQGGGAEA